VDELIGPDTITTMPVATFEAFLDHGGVEAKRARYLTEMPRATVV
jgi:hypothetical protein